MNLCQRCLLHALTVVVFIVQVALAAVALALGYVLLSDAIPVPEFLHGRIREELSRIGLEASFDSARFDPTGRILVSGLRLQPARFSEPIFESSLALIELDRIKLLAGQPELSRIEAEGVRLICPPSISPSGVAETLVRISTVRVTREGDTWTVDGLVGRAGPLEVVARGSFVAPPAREPARLPDFDRWLRSYAEAAPRFVRLSRWLEGARRPRLVVGFAGADKTVTVDAEISAEAWRDERYGEVRGLRLATSVRLGAEAGGPVTVVASAASFTRPDAPTVESIEVQARWPALPSAENPWPERLTLATGRVSHEKLVLPTVCVDLRPARYPALAADLALPLEGEPLALAVAANVGERSGTVRARGRFGRDWLARASEILGRDVTYYAAIEEPPDFAATVDVAPGLKWQRVDFRLLSGPVNARGVALDRARVRGTVTPARVEVDHLEMQRGDERAIGAYEDDLSTRENRFLLRGAMRPLSISPWFSGWWERFWDDYGFHAGPPTFDVDVKGSWVEGEKTIVTGRMAAEDVSIRGHAFGAVKSRFFIRPNYYDLHHASMRRAEGDLAGEVQLHFRPGDPNPARQAWRFDSTVDLVELADIFGPGGVELFEPYRYETPPAVEAEGVITQEGGEYDTDIRLRLRTGHPFRYHDFPLEALATEVRIGNRHVDLPSLEARYAGGTVTGTAVVDRGKLTFDAALKDADYDLAVETFGDFLDRRAPDRATPEDAKPSGFAGRKVGGRLDIKLAGSGPLTEYDAYEGSGEAQIRGGDLARVNLFGPLGDILNSVGIKMGTLRLHDAAGPFQVRRERLVFPRIRITGNTGALETEGTYFLRDGTVDFKARLFPLRESSGVFSQLFGVMLDPFSNLLEMRLTGTLRKPRWSFTRDPFALLRELTAKKEAEAQAAGAPAVPNGQMPPGGASAAPAASPEPAPPPPPTDSNAAPPAAPPTPATESPQPPPTTNEK